MIFAVLPDLSACHGLDQAATCHRSQTRCVDGRCRKDRRSEELQSRMLEVSCDPRWPIRMKVLERFSNGDPAHMQCSCQQAHRQYGKPTSHTRAVAPDRIPSNRHSAALGGQSSSRLHGVHASRTLRKIRVRASAQDNERQREARPRPYATRRSGVSCHRLDAVRASSEGPLVDAHHLDHLHGVAEPRPQRRLWRPISTTVSRPSAFWQ
ncbi:uncharacterized protein B0T15DRAFT_182534 [Chaetomium strumarium]|uniref:Uncharacterized protein n=1 Tax=Chaetomium strumarium TaxID=1170767 RepID=A0AAJ0GWT1_9PEZI|nr:hypothetical protein B0T15DRAFT_182534 [Chaetomium strumarium]